LETQNALVIGIGYVGIRLVEKINSLGIKVFGLSRNEKSLNKLERYNAKKVYWDEKSVLDFNLVDNNINFVLSSVPPNSLGNDPVLKIFNKKLSQYKGWLSSKHIVSSVLKNEFDYKFIHPDYKSGLKAIWTMKN